MCGAPLLVKTSNGALCPGAPLLVLEKKLLVVAHRGCGAPLVIWTLMAYLHMVRHCYIAVAHHICGAPLMSILAIALFLVVQGNFVDPEDASKYANFKRSYNDLKQA